MFEVGNLKTNDNKTKTETKTATKENIRWDRRMLLRISGVKIDNEESQRCDIRGKKLTKKFYDENKEYFYVFRILQSV